MTTQEDCVEDGEDDGNYDESPIKYQLQSNFKQQNNELQMFEYLEKECVL